MNIALCWNINILHGYLMSVFGDMSERKRVRIRGIYVEPEWPIEYIAFANERIGHLIEYITFANERIGHLIEYITFANERIGHLPNMWYYS